MRASVRRPGSDEKAARAFVTMLLTALAACSSPHGSANTRASASATASGAPEPRASSSGAPKVRDPAKARALLIEGRKLEKAEHWREALAKLAQASALSPDDVTILAELGWTALHAGDLDTAKRASEHALEVATDRRVRAQILYNLGRVAEANGDKAAAKTSYERSLALRESRSVEERLEGLGGAAPSASPSSTAAPAVSAVPVSPPLELPCNRTFPNTAALCECLSKSPDGCGADNDAPVSESGELEIVKTPTETAGETLFLLVGNDNGGVRPLAELGRDYHPGSFGIDDTAKVIAVDEQKIGDRRIAVVRSEVTDKDENNDGLELMTVRTLTSTICVLRNGRGPTTCPVVVPSEIDDAHTFPRPVESLGAGDKAYVESHAKEAHEIHVRLGVKINAKGEVLVTLDKGDEKNVAKGVLGRHTLF